MKKVTYLLNVFSLILLLANVAESADSVEYPRYLPPAQTRDEIIREELRKQQAQDRASPIMTVRFPAGKAELKPEYKKAVAGFAEYLETHPDATATINGYTDNVGLPDANVELSERRARKVKEILIKEFNIDESRLETVGWGGERPVASNKTAAGRQKNRRVEAVIGSK